MMKMKMKQARMQKALHRALAAQPIAMQALMAAALLCGCSDRIEQAAGPDLGGQPITLNIGAASSDAGAWSGGAWSGGAATRIATGYGHGENGTVFYAGEQFTAHFTAGSTVESAVYTIQSGAATAKAVSGSPAGNREPYFQPGATSATVSGYFPAVRPLKPSTWTVRTDQQTNDGFRLSDLMYAPEQTVTATASALTFEHRMARVRILINNRGFTNTGAYIVGGACRTVSIADPETLTPGQTLSDPVTDTDAGRIVVYSGATVNDGWNATCLLPPQVVCQQTTVGTPVAFLRLNYTGGDITFTMDPSRLESGKTYYIQITEIASWMMGQTLHLGAIGGNGTLVWAPPTASTLQQSSPGLYQVGGVTFRMQKVNGGSYTQTRNATTINGRLSDYWIAETETTQGLYRAVMGHLPYSSGTTERVQENYGDNYPCGWLVPKVAYGLDGVNGSFIDALNSATADRRPAGYVFDVASEAEWEWAAKGGIHTHGYTYAGTSTALAEYAVGNGYTTYAPVATKKPNELGLYDMSGNMWEDCRDRFPQNFYGTTQTVTAADDYCPWVEDAEALANTTLQTPAVGGCRGDNNVLALPQHHNDGKNWLFNFTTSNGINVFNTIRLVLRPVQQRFKYTGGVQTFTAPATGYYRIECWGAQGGSPGKAAAASTNGEPVGGKGAYASGYYQATAGTTLYVVVGGQGQTSSTTGTWSAGGYNGGGKGGNYFNNATDANCKNSGGGGATHVAKATGELKTVIASSDDNLIIVAGGGGGAANYNTQAANFTQCTTAGSGGYGGGSGAAGNGVITYKDTYGAIAATAAAATGATPSARGTGYRNTTATAYPGGDGGKGYGGDVGSTSGWGGGGGGGYWGGGGGGHNGGVISTGGGGSSWAGGCHANRRTLTAGNAQMPSPTGLVETGHTGNGYVRITYAGTTAP